MRNFFILLGIVGFVVICKLAFIIPENPYQIIPSFSLVGFDKPLWADIIIGGGFLYLIILFGIYDELTEYETKKEDK